MVPANFWLMNCTVDVLDPVLKNVQGMMMVRIIYQYIIEFAYLLFCMKCERKVSVKLVNQTN